MLAKRGAPTPSLAGSRESQEAPGTPQKWLRLERNVVLPSPTRTFVVGFASQNHSPFPVQFKYTFSDRVGS